jgi:hypothetical protein
MGREIESRQGAVWYTFLKRLFFFGEACQNRFGLMGQDGQVGIDLMARLKKGLM